MARARLIPSQGNPEGKRQKASADKGGRVKEERRSGGEDGGKEINEGANKGEKEHLIWKSDSPKSSHVVSGIRCSLNERGAFYMEEEVIQFLMVTQAKKTTDGTSPAPIESPK